MPTFSEGVVKYKAALIGAVACMSLAAAPLSSASAHGYYHGGHGGRSGDLLGLGLVAGAVIGGVVALATAPVRVLEAPPPRPVYVAPAPVYYQAPYPAYGYYAPAPVYAAPGYYYHR
jgi:hypothetical protein